jgi:hypothetical protein
MPETTAPTPPPLTQDPEAPTLKPLIISQNDGSSPRQFDATKVLAAIGLILTITIIIVGIMWLTIQNLEQRVGTLETDLTSTSVNKNIATQAAAKIIQKTATKSASSSAN